MKQYLARIISVMSMTVVLCVGGTAFAADDTSSCSGNSATAVSSPVLSDVSISYAAFEKPGVSVGDTQKIAMLWTIPSDVTLQSAVLTYEIEGIGLAQKEAQTLYVYGALFELSADDLAYETGYLLQKIDLTLAKDGQDIVYSIPLGTGLAFDVVQKQTVASYGAQDMTTTIISTGDTSSLTARAAVMTTADGESAETDFTPIVSPLNNVTIVIDPGHGAEDGGAVGNGLKEADLCWSVSVACAHELQNYPFTDVYLTRGQDENPTLNDRVAYAIDHEADALVSMHFNSFTNSVARGVEVWAPHEGDWEAEDVVKFGNDMAQSVLDQLVSLGFQDRGVKQDTYGTTYYPDGTTGDIWAVVRGAREAGIPAILVEHGFVSNPTEASWFYDESFLWEMGQADAYGIAETFGLGQGEWVSDELGNHYLIDGEPVQYGWMRIHGSWYYFMNGVAYQNAWLKSNGSWYYFGDDCHMLTNEWGFVDGHWYYLDGYGHVVSGGWFGLSGTWYFADFSGACVTGWNKVGGTWYYHDPSCAMHTGWLSDPDNSDLWYYLYSDGSLHTGWLKDANTWYLASWSGDLRIGWYKDAGTWYYFNPQHDGSFGAMQTGWEYIDGYWYYMSGSGAMQTGWLYDAGTWYHLDNSGKWDY